MLKTVGTSGQITLGKKFEGQCFEVRIWPKITSLLLVCCSFPSSRSLLYTQVLGTRHSGRDCRNPVHRDVNLRAGTLPKLSTCAIGKLPSMDLDSGIPAGMTAFLAWLYLCIKSRDPAWEWGFEAPASRRTAKQELAR